MVFNRCLGFGNYLTELTGLEVQDGTLGNQDH